MTRHRLLLVLLFSLLLGGVAGAVGLWYFFGGPAPAAADLDDAAGAISTTKPGTPVDANGTWTVDNSIGNFSDYSSSWAGFRVAEVLDNIGDTEAVGRTPQVTGTLTLDGDALSATQIQVELTSIRSDRERRDPAIQRTLETSQFPTATFELADPIDLPSTPAEGVTYNLSTTGALTVHGVTQQVPVDLEARLVNDVIVVVGSMPFTFADYGMSAPRAPVVLSVSDGGNIEFQLFFTRAES